MPFPEPAASPPSHCAVRLYAGIKQPAGQNPAAKRGKAMKVLIFGATGMVGQGVLRECLRDPEVELVSTVGRTPAGEQHAKLLRGLGSPGSKLREIVHPDLADLSAIEGELTGFDACFFTARRLFKRDEGSRLRPHHVRPHPRRRQAAQPPQPRHDVYLRLRRRNRQHRAGSRHVGARQRPDGKCPAPPAAQRLHVPSRHHPAARRHPVEDARLPHRPTR